MSIAAHKQSVAVFLMITLTAMWLFPVFVPGAHAGMEMEEAAPCCPHGCGDNDHKEPCAKENRLCMDCCIATDLPAIYTATFSDYKKKVYPQKYHDQTAVLAAGSTGSWYQSPVSFPSTPYLPVPKTIRFCVYLF